MISRFYRRVQELLHQGRSFAVVHLVKAIGSAPQSPGAKMIVHSDKRTEFTIGGGPLEAQAAREAVLLFDHERTKVQEYSLAELGMHCGGGVRLFYELIKDTKEEAKFYDRVQELLTVARSFVIAHVTSASGFIPLKGGAKMILHPTGETEFKIEEIHHEGLKHETDALFFAGGTILKEYGLEDPHCGGSLEVFLEVVNNPLRLLIFGGGHVGAKLAELAAVSGTFQVEVADDRAEYATAERLPFADKVDPLAHNYSGDLPEHDKRTFVAILTRCHQTDKVVLEKILNSDGLPRYVGMIGSAAKRAKLFERLRDEGVPERRLKQVHTPIGLPIGGNDPGEIATSILAEMIKVKYQK